VEMVVVLAVFSIIGLLTIPPLVRMMAATRVRLAAAELVSVLREARSLSIRFNARVGVKFYTEDRGRVEWVVYRDGDGDGVRTADIRAGIDPPVTQRRRFVHLGGTVGFGIPADLAPRDPGDPRRLLTRLDDPIRFNRSDIASFGPLGTSTPGSLYVSDGFRNLAVVRVMNQTSKTRVLVYDPDLEIWR